MRRTTRLALLLCALAVVLTSVPLAQTKGATRMRVLVTAYAPGCGDSGGGTATGHRTGWGIIAVDPRVIRMHARIYVPHYGMGRAEDTGGAIRGAHIDTWLPSCRAAIRATRYETITVYG